MVGTRSVFRYQFASQSGNDSRRCRVRVDSDSTTLILNGDQNNEASPGTTANNYLSTIPPVYTGKSINMSARAVRVEFTGGQPAERVTPSAWVVVFQIATFNNFAVGQTGTYRGLDVECVEKKDGSPTVTGAA